MSLYNTLFCSCLLCPSFCLVPGHAHASSISGACRFVFGHSFQLVHTQYTPWMNSGNTMISQMRYLDIQGRQRPDAIMSGRVHAFALFSRPSSMQLSKVRWPLQFDSFLHHTVAYLLPIIRPQRTILLDIIHIPRLPFSPIQPAHPRAKHGINPTDDQADTNRAIGIAIHRPVRVLSVAFQPDMVVRNNLRGPQTRFTSDNTVARKTDDTLDGDMMGIGR